ncbi:MAG: hypothetical protein JW934_14340 [Anaerolineae bacterium]|nr:hypothetical protein [Anaerolineae bacterium]
MNKRCPKIVFSFSCIFFALALLSAPVVAELPIRPDDTPTPKPTRELRGGAIELSVTGAAEPVYAIVQWQDGLGGWHDVDGWRGEVENNRVLWFVPEDMFGDGPFRWVLYNEQEIWATSDPFSLPTFSGQIVRVSIGL